MSKNQIFVAATYCVVVVGFFSEYTVYGENCGAGVKIVSSHVNLKNTSSVISYLYNTSIQYFKTNPIVSLLCENGDRLRSVLCKILTIILPLLPASVLFTYSNKTI